MHANSWNQTIQLRWPNEFMNRAVSIEIDVTNRSFHDHFIVLSQSLLKLSRFYSSYVTFSQLVTWIDWGGRKYAGSSHVKCDPVYCLMKLQSFKVMNWSDSVRAWNLVKVTFLGISRFYPTHDTFNQLVAWIDWGGREQAGSSHAKCDPVYCLMKLQSFKVMNWSDGVQAWNLMRVTLRSCVH